METLGPSIPSTQILGSLAFVLFAQCLVLLRFRTQTGGLRRRRLGFSSSGCEMADVRFDVLDRSRSRSVVSSQADGRGQMGFMSLPDISFLAMLRQIETA